MFRKAGSFNRLIGSAVYTMCVALLGLGIMTPTNSHADEGTARSVSQHGITWYFADERPVGRYANGDWWVLGPVTITEITPRSENQGGRVINGTSLSPVGGQQGFDSFSAEMDYRSEMNVAPSIRGRDLVVSEDSVVSSISLEAPNSNGRPVLSDLAILTVVSERPPSGAFRPSPYRAENLHSWQEQDLDYSILQSLPFMSNTPDIRQRSEEALRFWTEQAAGDWQQRTVQARNNMPVYGREIQQRSGEMLLLLHLDFSNEEKRDLFVGLVQMGLDIFARYQEGGSWMSNGGHNNGRKMPMLLAGLALNDEEIISVARRDADDPDRFSDDGQTFIVSQADIDRNHRDGRGGYTAAHLGMPEWGIRHATDPTRDGLSWGVPYRWIGAGFIGHALAARLTVGAKEAWGWPAYFEYADRYYEKESGSDANWPVGAVNGIGRFQQAMWEAYRDDADSFVGRRPRPPVLQAE